MMKYRQLGKSGLKVSEIALGSWLTYGTITEKEQAIACVKQAYDLGINHFDCADVYGAVPHGAEVVLGEALAPYNRDSYIVTSKAGWPLSEGPNDRGLSRKHLFSELEKSLRSLNVDYIDIFYCHRFDPDTNLEETLRALDDLVHQGKILYAGLSGWTAEEIDTAAHLQRELNLHKFVASQPVYNMLDRDIEEAVIPASDRAGIGQVVFSPLAQGILTGKYKANQPAPEGSRGATELGSHFITHYHTEENLNKVEQLAGVAKELNITLPQLALAWILRLPSISSALIGASKPAQVVENVGAIKVELDSATLEKIEEILKA